MMSLEKSPLTKWAAGLGRRQTRSRSRRAWLAFIWHSSPRRRSVADGELEVGKTAKCRSGGDTPLGEIDGCGGRGRSIDSLRTRFYQGGWMSRTVCEAV